MVTIKAETSSTNFAVFSASFAKLGWSYFVTELHRSTQVTSKWHTHNFPELNPESLLMSVWINLNWKFSRKLEVVDVTHKVMFRVPNINCLSVRRRVYRKPVSCFLKDFLNDDLIAILIRI